MATTLRNCTQLLEILQVLGVDTRNVVLEKKILECVKKEPCVEEKDSSFESNDDDEEDEVGIVYEGQGCSVPRSDRVSFVTVKTEVTNNTPAEDATTLSDTRRGRLTPLLSPTPPVTSSCSLTSSSAQGYNSTTWSVLASLLGDMRRGGRRWTGWMR